MSSVGGASPSSANRAGCIGRPESRLFLGGAAIAFMSLSITADVALVSAGVDQFAFSGRALLGCRFLLRHGQCLRVDEHATQNVCLRVYEQHTGPQDVIRAPAGSLL